MLDADGGVHKSVATGVMSSPARVVEWIDEVLDTRAVERSAFVAALIGTWMGTHMMHRTSPRINSAPGRTQRHVKTNALAAQGRCCCGQPSLPIAVTNHIDVVGGSFNDGITRRQR